MKKTLLIIINFVLCMTTLHAQILYSMTGQGGNYGGGTIIKFLPATNELTAVKSVEWQEGFTASGSMVHATDGKLYGMTTSGGANGLGVFFSYHPFSSTYTNGSPPRKGS